MIKSAIDSKYEWNITPATIAEEANRIIAEARAWVKKYFNLASEENWLVSEEIKGINDKRLSSSPIQAVNHDDEETAIIIPNVNVEKNKR